MSPVPFISLLFKSKFPPSCGLVSSTTLPIPPPPSLAVATAIAVTCPLLSRVISCINVLPLLSEELAALIVGWSVLLIATKEPAVVYLYFQNIVCCIKSWFTLSTGSLLQSVADPLLSLINIYSHVLSYKLYYGDPPSMLA